MLIELTENEIEELKDLKEIFDEYYVDNEKVICFDIIDEIFSERKDIEELCDYDKKKLKDQLLDSSDWLASLNCKAEVIGKLIGYFG